MSLIILAKLVALLIGGVIGLSFGLVQQGALRRYERLQQSGRFNTGWAVIPGSFRRVAYLMVALALVQIICPMLFADSTQWWVSAGVAAGYGWHLLRQFRQQRRSTILS